MVIWRKISYNWRLVNNFVMQRFHLIIVSIILANSLPLIYVYMGVTYDHTLLVALNEESDKKHKIILSQQIPYRNF